jgi:hypothetical protein
VAEKTWRQADHRGSTEGLLEASMGPASVRVRPVHDAEHRPAEGPRLAGHRRPDHRGRRRLPPTAFALAFRPLELPPGARDAAIQSYKGFGLRVIYDYDMDKKQMVCSIDCLYGTKTLDANRAVLIKGIDHA